MLTSYLNTHLAFALMPCTSLALSCALTLPIQRTLYLFTSSLWTLHQFIVLLQIWYPKIPP